MARKPSYEELDRRVKELEKESVERKQIEEALRETEERHRKVFEEAQDGIFLADAETGVIVDCNSAGAQLVDRERSELIGQHQRIVHPPQQDNESFSETFKKHLGEHEGEVLETQVITSTGEIKEVAIKANLLHIGDRKLLQGMFRDITERKQAQEALRASEEKYRSILENITDGYYEADLAGNLTFFNESLCRVYGYPRDELTGMNYRQYMDGENAKKVFKVYNKVYRTGKPVGRFSWEFTRKDGKRGYVEASVTLMKDSKGQPIGFRGIGRDITDRVRAVKELKASEEKHRTILENIEEGYYEVDLAGNLTFFNDSMRKVLGYPKDELIGMNNRRFMAPDTAKTVYQVFNKVYNTGKADKGTDWELTRKDGIKRTVETSVVLMKDEEGRPIGFRGVARDITDRKRLESQLREAQRLEALGTLAGGIAHEFNNMLWLVTGNIELALDKIPEENPAVKKLERVISAVLRARDLVEKILTFSRQAEQEPQQLEISSIVKESLSMLRTSISENIEIRKEISADSDTILADPGQINQVFANLCINAAYAMREEGGILDIGLVNVVIDGGKAALYQDLNPGKYVKLTVSDTGHGMDPETKDRIFDPFFTTKEIGEGTGMGLSAVYGIVKSYGGTITVDSEPGKGATFQVLLPCIESEVEPKTETTEAVAKGNERILFIDDEELVAETMKEMLLGLGYEVISETNPIKAREAFRAESEKFDLVITDLGMSEMTGEELAKEMMEIRPDIPIILLTGYNEMISEEEVKDLGIKEFIMKPIGKHEMAKAIRNVLAK